MTHSTFPAANETGTPLPRIGGVLAIAGTFIGTGIFVLGCFGFQAAFALALIPALLGAVGLVLSLSGLFFKRIAAEDPQVVAALLLSIAVLVGGILEICIWRGVPFFAGQGGM